MGSPGASFWRREWIFLCTSPLFLHAEGPSNQLVSPFSASPNYEGQYIKSGVGISDSGSETVANQLQI
jgi:hypothetical protein